MSLTELTGNPRHDQLLTLIADRGYMNIDERSCWMCPHKRYDGISVSSASRDS
ncbi:protein YihW [Enterobacter kobei]|nr:protein YihW [Enterobacter kobei]